METEDLMLTGRRYNTIDDRYMKHPGVIIDIGCYKWSWSRLIKGERRIIGYDCIEGTEPPNCKLYRCAVMAERGTVAISGAGQSVSAEMVPDAFCAGTMPAVSIHDVLQPFDTMPAIIKMNVEGAEYEILDALMTRETAPADQLIVAFHDRNKFAHTKDDSLRIRLRLSRWYNWTCIDEPFSWWLGLLKDEYRTVEAV